METIDLSKDPYFMRNHLGQYECRLCLTLHNNEGNYLAHTQVITSLLCTACILCTRRQHVPLGRLKAAAGCTCITEQPCSVWCRGFNQHLILFRTSSVEHNSESAVKHAQCMPCHKSQATPFDLPAGRTAKCSLSVSHLFSYPAGTCEPHRQPLCFTVNVP